MIPPRRSRRLLAGSALLLGLLAPLAGSPYLRERARVDVPALAASVARGDDHVDAVTLASWIRERRPGLRVVDLRPEEEYRAYHVPSAERLPLESLAAASFRPEETVVLTSAGGTHAAQAWVLLRALGHKKAYSLRGGVEAWLSEVMSPALAPDASPEAKAEFERVAPLSRYFGGAPRRADPGVSAPPGAASPGRRGGGC